MAARRLLRSSAVLALLAALGTLIVQNVRLKRELAALPHGTRRLPALSFQAGDSLQQLLLLDANGTPTSARAIAAHCSSTIFHFVARGCDACNEEAPTWADFIALHGSDNLVFIICDDQKPGRPLKEPDLPLNRLYWLVPPAVPMSSWAPRVPSTVVVNEDAIAQRIVRAAGDISSFTDVVCR